MRVFVIHYKKLIDRKENILKQFNKYNITDYEFIDIDRDELDNHDIDIFEENYSKSQIAILLSHFHAYNMISKNEDENGLILEDDVILCNNFIEIFNKYITQLPNDYDMLFIGDGCKLHIEKKYIKSNQFIYEKGLYPTKWGGDGATRCTDSYLINKTTAIKICKYIQKLTYKINQPIDWWLNKACRDNNFKIYWAEPTIVSQGTQNGTYTTSH